jgi:hypothetical protein
MPESRVEGSNSLVDASLKRERPFDIIKSTLKKRGITGLYSGASALIIGNAAKASRNHACAGEIVLTSTGWRSVFDLRLVQTCTSGQGSEEFHSGLCALLRGVSG